jgi:hypothetical protein
MNSLIFICALIYLAEHMLGSMQFLPQNPPLLFALYHDNHAHSFYQVDWKSGWRADKVMLLHTEYQRPSLS